MENIILKLEVKGNLLDTKEKDAAVNQPKFSDSGGEVHRWPNSSENPGFYHSY